MKLLGGKKKKRTEMLMRDFVVLSRSHTKQNTLFMKHMDEIWKFNLHFEISAAKLEGEKKTKARKLLI